MTERYLRLLLVEDSEDDAFLLSRHFRRAGYKLTIERVSRVSTYTEQLTTKRWDAILCDYNLPGFDAWSALKLYRDAEIDTPFFVISGMLSDEEATDLMREGVHDFVPKDRLARVVPAVEREVREAKVRRARRRTELDLLAERVVFRQTFEQAPMGIAHIDFDGTVRRVNRRLGELLGFDADDMVRGKLLEALGGSDATQSLLTEMIAEVQSQGHSVSRVMPVVVSEATRLVRVTLSLAGAPPLVMSYLIGVFDDVTSQAERARALEVSERRLRVTLDSIADAVVTFDQKVRITSSNQAAELMFRLPQSELVGRSITDFLELGPNAEEAKNTLLAWRERFESAEQVVDARSIDGGSLTVSVRVRALDAPGDHAVATIRDVSARRQLEDQRRELQRQHVQMAKMEALGTLAGGIAHDFNNLLGPILAHASQLEKSVDGDALEALRDIRLAGMRARGLVEQIKQFSRSERGGRDAVDLGELCQQVVRLLQPTVPKGVLLAVEVGRGSVVYASAGGLHQVLTNLLINAIRAVGARGTVEIRCDTSDAEQVVLEVEDDGVGIPPEVLDRVFDPFFTTHGADGGTGLGLSNVFSIVRRHEGEVTVSSTVGVGTTFRVVLPKHRGQGIQRTPAEGLLALVSLEDLVFAVVDDDALARRTTTAVLKRQGAIVEAFEDPLMARDALLGRADDLDFVILDLSMPGMKGTELAAQLLKRAPELPILLCTGNIEASTEHEVEALSVGYLSKPFLPEELMMAIARQLSMRQA